MLLAACASVPPAQNQQAETEDLAMFSSAALQLGGLYGNEKYWSCWTSTTPCWQWNRAWVQTSGITGRKTWRADDPCSGELVSNRFRVQGALMFASAMRPTQPDAAQQVKRMQDAGLKVISVTSRGTEYRLQTFRELRRNGFSFWSSALPPQQGFPEDFIPQGGTRPARYEEGVFLTSGQHKGDMIKALLAKTGTAAPKVIIMADDKQANLQAVMEAFEGSGTAVHAWRYTREDANVAAFNTEEAAAQWRMVKPALMKLELIFGTDNFDLPAQVVREGCGVMPESRE